MQSYLIYNPEDDLSTKLAGDSLDSAAAHGMQVDLFPGIFKDRVDDYLKLYSIKQSNLLKKTTKGEQGCFVSHYLLWSMSVEKNIPLLVLEHDIFVKHKIDDSLLNHFEDVLNLDYCSSLRKDIEMYRSCAFADTENSSIELLYKKNQIPKNITWQSAKTYHVTGSHAYIVKPAGALKLIKATEKHGYLPVDVHINCHYVEIYITKPSMVRTCDFMLNTKNRVKFSSTKKSDI
jgi:GR25 family glycosyltransferase involved in LPS biosynthesis